MKKVLFATTALVLSAGVAAAEVAVSGSGRMGVVYNGADWNFSSRARVTFTMTGQTDNGLEFGGSFDAHDSADAEHGNAGTVWISGAFGKIEMGDALSAPEALFGDFYEVGYTDIGNNDIPYLTGDGVTTVADNPVLLYSYSVGSLSLAASMSDGKLDSVDDQQEYAIAAAYSFGDYTVGLGYEALDSANTAVIADQNQLELAGVAKFGNTNVKAYIADGERDDTTGTGTAVDVKAYGIGLDTTFGATKVGGFLQNVEVGGADANFWGLGAEYDLGGGASIKGGIADNDLPDTDMVADLGVTFKF